MLEHKNSTMIGIIIDSQATSSSVTYTLLYGKNSFFTQFLIDVTQVRLKKMNVCIYTVSILSFYSFLVFCALNVYVDDMMCVSNVIGILSVYVKILVVCFRNTYKHVDIESFVIHLTCSVK